MNGHHLLVRILIGLAIGVVFAIITTPWLIGFWTIVRELLLK